MQVSISRKKSCDKRKTFFLIIAHFQSLHWGRELTDRALGQESANLFVSVDLVFSALDRLKEAELLSKGEDVELLCRSLAKEGVIYYVSGKVANDTNASFFYILHWAEDPEADHPCQGLLLRGAGPLQDAAGEHQPALERLVRGSSRSQPVFLSVAANLFLSIGRYKELALLVQEIRDREVKDEEGKWETKRRKHLDELKEELKEIR